MFHIATYALNVAAAIASLATFARRAAVSNELRRDVRLLAVEDAPAPNASPRPPPQSHLARPSRIKKLPGRLKRCDPFRASSASVAGGEATAIALELPC
jgi:hypothetical protein